MHAPFDGSSALAEELDMPPVPVDCAALTVVELAVGGAIDSAEPSLASPPVPSAGGGDVDVVACGRCVGDGIRPAVVVDLGGVGGGCGRSTMSPFIQSALSGK